ncbi:MAG: hypothetical protein P8017_10705 [Deltaproteobacteria bacterium]
MYPVHRLPFDDFYDFYDFYDLNGLNDLNGLFRLRLTAYHMDTR